MSSSFDLDEVWSIEVATTAGDVFWYLEDIES